MQITSPWSLSQLLSLSARPSVLLSVGLCSSVCVSPRLSWLPRGPASVAGNLQRSKAWIPPWVSPHTPLFPLSRAHFRPALSFHNGQKLRWPEENRAGSPRAPGDTASAKEPPQGVVGAWPCSPLLPLATPWEQGDCRVSIRFLLLCGHHCPHTLPEEAFPQFSGSRAPPALKSPVLAGSPCPNLKMSVCACLRGHR